MIRKIIFDYGGVFTVGSRAEIIAKILSKDKAGQTQIKKFFSSDFIRQAATGKYSDKQIILELQQLIIDSLDKNATGKVIDTAFAQACHPQAEIIQLLKQLQGNYHLYLLSDSIAPYSNYILNNLSSYFIDIFLSDKMGLRKSNGLYELAKIACPDLFVNAVYIDDRPNNVAIATNYGAFGILFQSLEALYKELSTLGVNIKLNK